VSLYNSAPAASFPGVPGAPARRPRFQPGFIALILAHVRSALRLRW